MISVEVITPVYSAGAVLLSCVRSVSDQNGQATKHLIQDGESLDELTCAALIESNADVVSERDSGMYDALNRALKRTSGDVIGHLNADEQYLPGVFGRVRSILESHPEVDVVCGDMILTDAQWNPLAYRVSCLPPKNSAGLIPLPIPTCGMFIRKRCFDAGLRYRDDLKAIADAVLVEDLLASGARWYLDSAPYAAFSLHGKNLSNSGAAEADLILLGRTDSVMHKIRARLSVWIKRWMRNGYRRRDVTIRIYETPPGAGRVERKGRNIGWHWPKP